MPRTSRYKTKTNPTSHTHTPSVLTYTKYSSPIWLRNKRRKRVAIAIPKMSMCVLIFVPDFNAVQKGSDIVPTSIEATAILVASRMLNCRRRAAATPFISSTVRHYWYICWLSLRLQKLSRRSDRLIHGQLICIYMVAVLGFLDYMQFIGGEGRGGGTEECQCVRPCRILHVKHIYFCRIIIVRVVVVVALLLLLGEWKRFTLHICQSMKYTLCRGRVRVLYSRIERGYAETYS